MRPRKESNGVYQESTVRFAVLFLDHLHCSVVQLSLIPSMVVESFFVLLWSWKLLLPEEMGSQHNVKSSRMSFWSFLFLAQLYNSSHANIQTVRHKWKENLSFLTLGPEQPHRLWKAFRPVFHCTRYFITGPVNNIMKRMGAWLLGWAIFQFSGQDPVFRKPFA